MKSSRKVKFNRWQKILQVSKFISVLDRLSTSLNAIKPFATPPTDEPTLEVAEFPGSSERDLSPHTNFLNHLYVYPLSLSFESQKVFSRARNLAVTVEVRNSDELDSRPLEVINLNSLHQLTRTSSTFILVHLPSAWSVWSPFRCSAFMPGTSSQHVTDVVRRDQDSTSCAHHATASFAVLVLSHLLWHQEEGIGKLAGKSSGLCMAAVVEQRKVEYWWAKFAGGCFTSSRLPVDSTIGVRQRGEWEFQLWFVFVEFDT